MELTEIDKLSTLIFIDWDDTLFPTTYVQDNNIKILLNTSSNSKLFTELDALVYNLLNNFNKYGKVVIVTNATKKWVQLSLNILPKTQEYIEKTITIVSARDMFKRHFPENSFKWKRLSFRKEVFTTFMNMHPIEYIISIGDAEYEYKALIGLYSKSNTKTKRILKAVKLIRYPSIEVLLDELYVLNSSVHDICINKDHMDLNFNLN